METLRNFDLHWCVSRLPKVLKEALIKHGSSVVVAGGFIRSCICKEPIADIDLFSSNPTVAKIVAESILPKNKRMIETENAYTVLGLGLPVQFIHRWTFDSPEFVVPSFDFTIARAAIWFERAGEPWEEGDQKGEWKSLCDPAFYPDLAAKRLVYCSPVRNEEAGGSMLRVLKFYKRGYTMPLDSLGAVLARMISSIPDAKFDQRYAAIGSDGFRQTWEKQCAHIMTGLLREVDPLIDPDHVFHLPSAKPEPQDEPAAQ